MDTAWQVHCDNISRGYIAAFDDNRHHASLPDELAVRIAIEHARRQAFCKRVNLPARIAQSGDFHYCLPSELQARPGWQSQQVETARCHVLADRTWLYIEALYTKLIQQLLVNEMHLPQVRPIGSFCFNMKSVLHLFSHVSIIFNAKSGNQANCQDIEFAEAGAAYDGNPSQ
jgi:hypothetical protein